jgi:hypothetical protein
MKTIKLFILFHTIAFTLPAAAVFEKWNNKDGKAASLELIRLTEMDGEKAAEFKMQNGKTVIIKLSTLADADAKRARESEKKTTPNDSSTTMNDLQPSKDVAPLLWLEKLPNRAKDFIIGNVIVQQDKDIIWWSGAFVSDVFNFNQSAKECLPSLIQLNLTTREIRIVTIPCGWVKYLPSDVPIPKGTPPPINPDDAVVHIHENRVVWQTGPLGVWEVDPQLMELKQLVEKPKRTPVSITSPMYAGAFIGDAFCYLEEDAPIRLDDDSVKFGACRVCCIRRGKPPVILVETLRRPEQSPLDVPNTALCGLVVIDDVLWVLANAEPAYYSRGIKAVGFPMGEPDGLKEVTDKQQVAGMFNTMKQGHKRFDKFLIGEGYSVKSSTKPNSLPVSGPAGENLVPLDLTVPENTGGRYQLQERKDDGSSGGIIEIDLNELVRNGYACPTVVGETDQVLFVMASVKIHFNTHLLPMIWTVSKDWLRSNAKR